MDSARKRGRPKLPFDEKKRRRSEQIASYNLRKVHIGIEIHRWNRLKLKKGLKTNAMVAEYLLNLAEREEEYKRPYGPPFTSTPFASPYIDDSKGFNAVFSGISDNDAASSVTEKEINVTSVSSLSSACGEVCDIMKKEQMSSNQRGTTGKRANAGKQLSSSFVDPYEISIDMSSEFEDTDISDDPDFEPSFTMEAVIPQELEEQLEDVNLEDIECGLDLEDNMPDEEKFDDGGEMIRESVGCEWLVNETKVIVYVSQLKKLSSISISPCTTCGSIKINMEETYCGSAIHIKWGTWTGVMHHIVNEHEWVLGNCTHGPIESNDRNKQWLHPVKDASTLKDLARLVFDKRLFNQIGKYLNFRTTAELEGFHQHILMYCAKRFAYSPPVYRARNILAALDHNLHLYRPNKLKTDGSLRLHRKWNKKSGRWTVHPIKEEKKFEYIPELLTVALKLRMEDKVGMKSFRELEASDPRRISSHLAPLKPPSSKEIFEEQVSRFS